MSALALWARGGLVEQFGDPLAIWQQWADRVEGEALAGGHFLMEQDPLDLSARLMPFLDPQRPAVARTRSTRPIVRGQTATPANRSESS